jgi:hypothetical protein
MHVSLLARMRSPVRLRWLRWLPLLGVVPAALHFVQWIVQTPEADAFGAPIHSVTDYLDTGGMLFPAGLVFLLLFFVPVEVFIRHRLRRGIPLALGRHRPYHLPLLIFVMGAWGFLSGFGSFYAATRLHERWGFARWEAQARRDCAAMRGSTAPNVRRFCTPSGQISAFGYCLLGSREDRCPPVGFRAE